MARATRSPRSNSSGPGRGQQRRSRASGRPASSPTPADPPTAAPQASEGRWRGLPNVGRAVTLLLVMIVLAISFTGSLQIYFRQQQDLATAEQQIRDRQSQVDELTTELGRWNDPAFVKAQARERLGWVLPGETGYRVVDDNGNPVGGGVVLESNQRPVTAESNQFWWQRLAGSLATADAPVRQVSKR